MGLKLITEIYNEPLSLLTEADATGKKHLYIQGPFAVSEVTNKNGRKYAQSLLESVISKFDKDYIKPARALGEMNHPCFKKGAKVFVQDKGLIPIENVKVGDFVYGTDSTNNSKPVLVKDVTKNKFTGNLINFSSRSFKATVTPYHRFYIKNRNGGFDVVTAQDIVNDKNDRKLAHSYIPLTMENWIGNQEETISFDSTNSRDGFHNYDYADKPLTVTFKDYCAFMGIFLSEGCVGYFTRKDGTKVPGEIQIAQNLGTNMDLILDLISKMGVNKYSIRVRDGIKGVIVISDIRLADYLEKFGNCYDKYVPEEILSSTKQNIEEFINWYHLGDGTNSKQIMPTGKECIQGTIFTVSEKLANGLIECLIKTGQSTTKRVQLSKSDYVFAERTIKIANKKPLFRMTMGKSIGKYVDDRFIKITEVPHDDDVFCLVTETENFFVEQDGTIFLSGNCRLSIDYERATHLITEMKQDKNVWIGKAKVLKTPMGKILEGLLESGVNVGVSTRGAGTIIESNGVKTVGNDFMMTAVDVVSDPSGQYEGEDGLAGCFVRGIMEGVEFTMGSNGAFIAQNIVELAKIAYDKKQLTNEVKFELFKRFVSEIKAA